MASVNSFWHLFFTLFSHCIFFFTQLLLLIYLCISRFCLPYRTQFNILLTIFDCSQAYHTSCLLSIFSVIISETFIICRVLFVIWDMLQSGYCGRSMILCSASILTARIFCQSACWIVCIMALYVSTFSYHSVADIFLSVVRNIFGQNRPFWHLTIFFA